MALEEASKYLEGDWSGEVICFNCKTLIKYTQDDIVDYEFNGHFGVQCKCCKFPLELTNSLPPIVRQRARKSVRDLNFVPVTSDSNMSETRYNFVTHCRTCRTKIKGFANHLNREIICPACSYTACIRTSNIDGQSYAKYSEFICEVPYVEAWISKNPSPIEVIRLSPFMTNEWSIKQECNNCKSTINVNHQSELTIYDDFGLKVRCEGCNKLVLINIFKRQKYWEDETWRPGTEPLERNRLAFYEYYLSHSNYDPKRDFPPIIFWRAHDLWLEENRQPGCFHPCVIS